MPLTSNSLVIYVTFSKSKFYCMHFRFSSKFTSGYCFIQKQNDYFWLRFPSSDLLCPFSKKLCDWLKAKREREVIKNGITYSWICLCAAISTIGLLWINRTEYMDKNDWCVEMQRYKCKSIILVSFSTKPSLSLLVSQALRSKRFTEFTVIFTVKPRKHSCRLSKQDHMLSYSKCNRN